MGRKPGKVNIPMILAAILLFLTLLSIHLTSGLYARYVTTASGSDSARVAKFGRLTLTEEGDFDGTSAKKGTVIPGVDLKKRAWVSFTASEVSTVVFVEIITNWDKAADGDTFSFGTGLMSWEVDDTWTYLLADSYNGMPRYVYYKTLIPNESLTADIIADEGKITVSTSVKESSRTALDGAYITLRASVIQSGGFETVKDAWLSMAGK